MAARDVQDSVDLGWSDEPPSVAVATISAADSPLPLDTSDDDEPTRVATSAALAVAPASTERVSEGSVPSDASLALPAEPVVDTEEPTAPSIEAAGIETAAIETPAIETPAIETPAIETRAI